MLLELHRTVHLCAYAEFSVNSMVSRVGNFMWHIPDLDPSSIEREASKRYGPLDLVW
jgi:hypothetical protein